MLLNEINSTLSVMMKYTPYIHCSDWFEAIKEKCTILWYGQQKRRRSDIILLRKQQQQQQQHHHQPLLLLETKRSEIIRLQIDCLSKKSQWAVVPISRILLICIKETFTYKGKDPKDFPINDFIRFYDRKMKKVNQRWLNHIIGSLTPFVTSLSSGFASQTDNISTSVSFFKS